jgi:hypothetical protein
MMVLGMKFAQRGVGMINAHSGSLFIKVLSGSFVSVEKYPCKDMANQATRMRRQSNLVVTFE